MVSRGISYFYTITIDIETNRRANGVKAVMKKSPEERNIRHLHSRGCRFSLIQVTFR